MRARRVVAGTLVTGLCLATGGTAVAGEQHSSATGRLDRVKHIVVIYEENHSFDNLYGGWEGVNGLANADPAHTTQVNQEGEHFTCLLQNDVNLTAPDPLPATCTDSTTATPFVSHFANSPFRIDDYIKPSDTTCPAPGASAPNGVRNGTGEPGGCTRDLVHRFYNEQYQLDGGRQDRYTTGSDAAGLTQGTYDTRALPIYRRVTRGTRSPTTSSRPRSAGRSSTTSGSSPRRRRCSRARRRAVSTICTPSSTRTGCRRRRRSTRRRSTG
jgi:phospholipase C